MGLKKIISLCEAQFVKAVVLSRVINEKQMTELIVHTGQHYDANMSAVFFEEMNIPKPDYQLETKGDTHAQMTAAMLVQLEEIFIRENPDAVLVYGDTNSTLAGALTASKMHIPLIHVEAGLRSFNMKMPEEVNRIVTDRLSSLLFCPTQQAINNLNAEGFEQMDNKVSLVGDIMKDAVGFYMEKARLNSTILERTQLNGKPFVLATVHRQENTDNKERLEQIFQSLDKIGQTEEVVLPLHPRTKKMLAKFNLHYPNIKMIDPLGYFDMLTLLANCELVLTDSGGLQKEAFFCSKIV